MGKTQDVVVKSILKTFELIKIDYIEDEFKYFSETDIVFAFAWVLKNQNEVKKLINNRIVSIHFEIKPTENSTQADLVVKIMNKMGEWLSSIIIEFKIRVNGNKDRMLLDIKKTKQLHSDGVPAFLCIFDQCAEEDQIKDFINQEIEINDRIRDNILWVSREDKK